MNETLKKDLAIAQTKQLRLEAENNLLIDGIRTLAPYDSTIEYYMQAQDAEEDPYDDAGQAIPSRVVVVVDAASAAALPPDPHSEALRHAKPVNGITIHSSSSAEWLTTGSDNLSKKFPTPMNMLETS